MWNASARSRWLCLIASTLTGCASAPPPAPVFLTLPPPPPALAQPCPASLPVAASGSASDLLASDVAWAKAYHQCRQRHLSLVEWINTTLESARDGQPPGR